MNTRSFDVSDTITAEVNDALTRGLSANAHARKAPPYNDKPISFVRRDAEGRIVAGLTGVTFWDWLYVDLLWVDEPLRRQGLGTALIQAAENEAIKRGCHSAFLWTESFEGPAFYPKAGYKEFVVLDDFPIGHQRTGFMKRLAA